MARRRITANRLSRDDLFTALMADKELADSIPVNSREDFDFLPVLGRGSYAVAFDLMNDQVLKLSTDEFEFEVFSAIKAYQDANDGEPAPGFLAIEELRMLPGTYPETLTGPQQRLFHTDDSVREARCFAVIIERALPLHEAMDEIAQQSAIEWTRLDAGRDLFLFIVSLRDQGDSREYATEMFKKRWPAKYKVANKAFADDLLDAWEWLLQRGFVLADLHDGNIGFNLNGEPVLIDLGHGTRFQPVQPNTGAGFGRVEASFVRYLRKATRVFHDLGTVELRCDEEAASDNGHGSERQFGFATTSAPWRISFARKTNDLAANYIDGLMAHEFGHIIDHRYGSDLPKMLGMNLPRSVERRADVIAEFVFGQQIRYGGPHLIQCVNCEGVSPRPKHLG